MAISAAAFVVQVPNGSVAGPTPYSIVAGDVSGGISIPKSFFTTVMPYGQTGFLPERLTLILTTTTPGTTFKAILKATKAATDTTIGLPVAFPAANAGDLTVDVSANGSYVMGPFTSNRFEQLDGSLLINFSGTLGVTTIAGYVTPYAPAGPRG